MSRTGERLTFELQTLHGDLSDVGGGTQVKLPDSDVDAQLSEVKEQERFLLLLPELLQGQQGLGEEPAESEGPSQAPQREPRAGSPP